MTVPRALPWIAFGVPAGIIVGIIGWAVLGPCDHYIKDQVAVPGTAWVVRAIFSSCSTFDSGWTEFVAVNVPTQREVGIATIHGRTTYQLSLAEPRQIAISMPNFTQLKIARREFDGIGVLYRETPP